MPVCVSLSLNVHLSICLAVCLSACLYDCLTVYPFAILFAYLLLCKYLAFSKTPTNTPVFMKLLNVSEANGVVSRVYTAQKGFRHRFI